MVRKKSKRRSIPRQGTMGRFASVFSLSSSFCQASERPRENMDDLSLRIQTRLRIKTLLPIKYHALASPGVPKRTSPCPCLQRSKALSLDTCRRLLGVLPCAERPCAYCHRKFSRALQIEPSPLVAEVTQLRAQLNHLAREGGGNVSKRDQRTRPKAGVHSKTIVGRRGSHFSVPTPSCCL